MNVSGCRTVVQWPHEGRTNSEKALAKATCRVKHTCGPRWSRAPPVQSLVSQSLSLLSPNHHIKNTATKLEHPTSSGVSGSKVPGSFTGRGAGAGHLVVFLLVLRLCG